jgi:hypothetical protein
MKCKRALAAAVLMLAGAARGDDLRVASGAILYESGLAAPAVELRSIDESGATWRASVTGWTIGVTREKPVERGRRLIFSINATPFDAHSSRRLFRDGVRDRALEFDDAAFDVRAGMRIRESEHATLEPALVIGTEVLGDNAPHLLRDRWSGPYTGVAVTQRLRYVTADDPFRSRIDGFEIAATGEIYGGKRTWSKLLLTETAGVPFGRVHVRQSVALFGGSGIDEVNAFLVGGSWDALGATAIYGRHYAEFRVPRGVSANIGTDVDLFRSLSAGVRASGFRGAGERATGVMLQLSGRLAGVRLTGGVGRSDGRRTVAASIGGALFR